MEQILIGIAFFIFGCAFGANVICNEDERLKGFNIGYEAGKKTGKLEELQSKMTMDSESLAEYFRELRKMKIDGEM